MHTFIGPISLSVLSQSEFDPALLHDEERKLVHGARSPSRIAEFGLGRVAARMSLASLGFTGTSPIGRGALGEPLWPEGINGSITHTKTHRSNSKTAATSLDGIFAAAVTARLSEVSALGIDIEERSRVISSAVLERICTTRELSWVQSGTHTPDTATHSGCPSPTTLSIGSLTTQADRGLAILLCKEALFKAISPLIKISFGFQEAEVHAEARDSTGGFKIVLSDRIKELGQDGSGLICSMFEFRSLIGGLVSNPVLK